MGVNMSRQNRLKSQMCVCVCVCILARLLILAVLQIPCFPAWILDPSTSPLNPELGLLDI